MERGHLFGFQRNSRTETRAGNTDVAKRNGLRWLFIEKAFPNGFSPGGGCSCGPAFCGWFSYFNFAFFRRLECFGGGGVADCNYLIGCDNVDDRSKKMNGNW